MAQLRTVLGAEDYRRWFGETAYASDSGNQITVWVPTETIRRQLTGHFQHEIDRALRSLGRTDTSVRFVVGGTEEDEHED